MENPCKVSILPRLSGLGGPVSFYNRLVNGLAERGVEIEENPLSPDCRAVLVIGGGGRQLNTLIRIQRKGVRIVQRLNGMNWMHRRRKTSWKYYMRCEWNNWVLSFIRRHLADRVVYQSQFARSWWQTVYKPAPADHSIVYNGVDLKVFTPNGPETPPADHTRILLVEAHIREGYEQGLENAIRLARSIQGISDRPVELVVAGDVSPELKAHWDQHAQTWITWAGVQPRESIPALDRSAHLLFSSDLNAACPNSVIEAMACGLPVIGFATGSLPELIQGDAGRVVPYGSNYWNLETPDVSMLAGAACDILADYPKFRLAARMRAESTFGIDGMVDRYMDALLK